MDEAEREQSVKKIKDVNPIRREKVTESRKAGIKCAVLKLSTPQSE